MTWSQFWSWLFAMFLVLIFLELIMEQLRVG